MPWFPGSVLALCSVSGSVSWLACVVSYFLRHRRGCHLSAVISSFALPLVAPPGWLVWFRTTPCFVPRSGITLGLSASSFPRLGDLVVLHRSPQANKFLPPFSRSPLFPPHPLRGVSTHQDALADGGNSLGFLSLGSRLSNDTAGPLAAGREVLFTSLSVDGSRSKAGVGRRGRRCSLRDGHVRIGKPPSIPLFFECVFPQGDARALIWLRSRDGDVLCGQGTAST